MATRKDEIEQSFRDFHAAHPECYTAFEKYTFEVIEAGLSQQLFG